MKIAPLLLLLATIPLLVCAQVQLVDPDSPKKNREIVRMELNRSPDTPDYIAFHAFLRHIHLVNERDRAAAIYNIQRIVRFSSESQAEQFLDTLLAADAGLKDDERQSERSLLCAPTGQRSKERIYQNMDALDDIREVHMQKHYILTMSTLDDSSADKFRAHLDKMKGRMYYSKSEHQSMYEGTAVDVTTTLQQICSE